MSDHSSSNGGTLTATSPAPMAPTPPADKPAKAAPTVGAWKASGKAKPVDLVDLAAVLRDRYGAIPAGRRDVTAQAVEAVLFDPLALAAVLAIVAAGSGTQTDYDDAKRLALRQLNR